MAKGLVSENSLNGIAEAINVLNGTEGTYYPSEMGAEIIDAIPTETASGNPIHITNAAAYPAESVVTTLEPIQDLHGYDKPWPAGGGVNKFDPVDTTPVGSSRAFNMTVSVDETEETITVSGSASWSASGGSFSFAVVDVTKNYTGMVGNVFVVSKSSNITRVNSVSYSNGAIVINVTVTADGTTSIVLKISFAETAQTAWSPYSNICPITGHTGVELKHSGADTSIYETHSITFPQAQTPVYGCEVDWTNGVLRVTEANIASYNDETLPSTWISDRDVYVEGTTPTTGAQVVYELATPQTYQLTPQEIQLLKGENNIFADNGTTEVQYKVDLQTYIEELKNSATRTLNVSPLSLNKADISDTDLTEEEPVSEEVEEEKIGGDND